MKHPHTLLLLTSIILILVSPTPATARTAHSVFGKDANMYHTWESMEKELLLLERTFPEYIHLKHIYADENDIQNFNRRLSVVSLTNEKGIDEGNRARILFAFGEHGRELVPPEIAMCFVKLVGQAVKAVRDAEDDYDAAFDVTDFDSEQHTRQNENAKFDYPGFSPCRLPSTTSPELYLNSLISLLNVAEIRLVPMMNPSIRPSVERGELCLRPNVDQIDLNRNYGYHWVQNNEFNSGSKPFSAWETTAFIKMLDRWKPDAYFNVHSGARELLAPWDFASFVPLEAEKRIIPLLENIRHRHCSDCIVGGGGRDTEYLAPGSSVDHLFGVLDVGMTATFEVFGAAGTWDEEEEEHDCFSMFNPQPKSESLISTKTDWAAAMYTASESVLRSVSGSELFCAPAFPSDASLPHFGHSHGGRTDVFHLAQQWFERESNVYCAATLNRKSIEAVSRDRVQIGGFLSSSLSSSPSHSVLIVAGGQWNNQWTPEIVLESIRSSSSRLCRSDISVFYYIPSWPHATDVLCGARTTSVHCSTDLHNVSPFYRAIIKEERGESKKVTEWLVKELNISVVVELVDVDEESKIQFGNQVSVARNINFDKNAENENENENGNKFDYNTPMIVFGSTKTKMASSSSKSQHFLDILDSSLAHTLKSKNENEKCASNATHGCYGDDCDIDIDVDVENTSEIGLHGGDMYTVSLPRHVIASVSVSLKPCSMQLDERMLRRKTSSNNRCDYFDVNPSKLVLKTARMKAASVLNAIIDDIIYSLDSSGIPGSTNTAILELDDGWILYFSMSHFARYVRVSSFYIVLLAVIGLILGFAIFKMKSKTKSKPKMRSRLKLKLKQTERQNCLVCVYMYVSRCMGAIFSTVWRYRAKDIRDKEKV